MNDYEGKYGMSELTFGIPITSKKQGDEIVKAINTDKFKQIINATKWGAFQTDWRMFKYFKPDFYKYFLKKDNHHIEEQSGHSDSVKKEAAKKIKAFVTKKHREHKNTKSKNGKSGGKRYTKKTNKKNLKQEKINLYSFNFTPFHIFLYNSLNNIKICSKMRNYNSRFHRVQYCEV